MSSGIKIIIYRDESGREPLTEWLDSLDKTIRGKILARIDRLTLGNAGNAKALKGGLYELKIDLGPGYRVYYGFVGKQLVLLISGGNKRSQSKGIEKAKKILEEYKE